MAFVQIIEMTTTKVPEIEEVMNGWMAATEGRRSARRSLLTKDRERPDTYVQVVEFPSYEEAMANSALPRDGGVRREAVGALRVRAYLPQSRRRSRRRAVANRIRQVRHASGGRTATAQEPEGYRTTSYGGSLRRCRFWPNGVPQHSSTITVRSRGHLIAPPEQVYARLAAQDHRRFIKTHTPLDGIPLDPQATYMGAGNNGPVSTAMASSFLNAAGTMGG